MYPVFNTIVHLHTHLRRHTNTMKYKQTDKKSTFETEKHSADSEGVKKGEKKYKKQAMWVRLKPFLCLEKNNNVKIKLIFWHPLSLIFC